MIPTSVETGESMLELNSLSLSGSSVVLRSCSRPMWLRKFRHWLALRLAFQSFLVRKSAFLGFILRRMLCEELRSYWLSLPNLGRIVAWMMSKMGAMRRSRNTHESSQFLGGCPIVCFPPFLFLRRTCLLLSQIRCMSQDCCKGSGYLLLKAAVTHIFFLSALRSLAIALT